MIIDPRYLMQIAAIVECGSFSAAAERLGTSQPGLSRTVSIIEKRTGQLLFDRNNRPPTPTEACRALAEQGRAIRMASEHAAEAIARISNGEFGRIRIGAPPFLCDHLLSGFIAEFIGRYPGVRIELIPDFIGGLQERLLADQIDMIVVAITIIDKTLPFKIERLMEDNNVIVCRAGHPLAHKKQIKNSDLEDALWISHSSTSTLHADMQAALTAAGVNRIKYSFESPSAGAVLKVLLSTDCLTMLPSNAASQLASEGQLRILSFAHATPSRPIGLVMNSGRAPTAALKRMVTFLRERLKAEAPSTTPRRQGTAGRGKKAQR